MTGGDAVVHALRAVGVEHVFGIVSVHNIPIYDAIERIGGITPISVRHEQGATHAADGYARTTGKLGVVIASTGPGAANTVSGLHEAGTGSSRVLMITGQIETHWYGKGKGALHEAEQQVPMLRSVCRRVESVRRTEDIAEAILRVATDINTGRPQPGAVEIPIDLQYATADVEAPPSVESWPTIAPDEGALERAAELLREATRPLIWSGGGVLHAGGWEPLVALAERLNAPVLTSLAGRGAIPEDHPLCLGALGPQREVQLEVVGNADVVLAVGTRFAWGDIRNWGMKIPGKIIHLDADPGVIGRNYPPAVSVVGDARLGLERLVQLVESAQTDGAFTREAQEARDAVRGRVRELIGPDYEAIMDTIRDLSPRDANMVRDATVPAYVWGDRLLPILTPRTSMRPASAAIGPGLPHAVGAAVGTGRRTVLIVGDGGIMLSVGELATAVQYSLPITVLLFNDGGYGVLRTIQDRTFEGRQSGVDLATPDFAKLAEAVGMPGERVESVESFREAFKRALDIDGPALLDIQMGALHPMTPYPPAPRS